MWKLIPVSKLRVGNIIRGFSITLHPTLLPFYQAFMHPNKEIVSYSLRLDPFGIWIPDNTQTQSVYDKYIPKMKLITNNDVKKTLGVELTDNVFEEIFTYYNKMNGENKYYKVVCQYLTEHPHGLVEAFTCIDADKPDSEQTIQLFDGARNLYPNYIENQLIYKNGIVKFNVKYNNITHVHVAV